MYRVEVNLEFSNNYSFWTMFWLLPFICTYICIYTVYTMNAFG